MFGSLRWRLERRLKERAARKKIIAAKQWLGGAIDTHLANVHATGDVFLKKSFFSQNGEDGVLAALLDHLSLELDSGTIEFGFSIFENNTLASALSRNSRALFLDGSQREIDNADKIISMLALDAVRARRAFITRENINDIISSNWDGDIDVLSIDVDGNDYWLWEAFTVSSPSVVVIEYNASFGKDRSVTVPYKPDFDRLAEHSSGLYHGASLRALCQLAKRKGYLFYGTDAEGLNAYFVNQSLVGAGPHVSVDMAFRSHSPRVRRGLTQEQQEEITSSFDLVDIPILDDSKG